MRSLAIVLLAALINLGGTAEQARFVGAEVCIGCHSDPELGNQALIWLGSAHARTYLLLETGYEEMIPERARPFVDPGYGRAIKEAAERLGSETECHQCHAAGARIDPELMEATFHIEDGVQCEACHGPGSVHVERKRADPDTGPPHGIAPADKSVCITCHRHKPSHDAVIGPRTFDVDKAWPKIAHPRP